jgi:RNA polymerase primary sigma factor
VLYYGLERDEPMTLDQIAQQLGVTRERVRQLRDRALGALRSGEEVEALRDALREEWAA